MKSIIYFTLLFIPVVFIQAQSDKSYERFEVLTADAPSHSRDANWKPGDGITLEVSGMEWLGDSLAVCIRKGEVWIIENPKAKNREDIKFLLFATGLHEPLGLLKEGDDLLVSQRGEITRLKDRDNDGVADAYLTECDGWNVSGNYHAYAYGPERDGQGNLWVSLNLGMGKLADNKIGWRGWVGTIGKDGTFQPKSLGTRSPSGFGANLEGDLFFSDQQGTWIPATPIYHMRPGVFYGNQESLQSLDSEDAPFKLSKIPTPNQPYGKAVSESKEFVPPAVWLPYNKMGRSATDVRVIDCDGKFGPFDGQLLIGEFTNAAISRVFLEKVDDEYQGACFPFLDRFPSAVFRLEIDDEANLYVGMTNRGWSSLGNRSYGLERVNFNGETPFAIKEMRANKNGFTLEFTKQIKPESASKINIQSFTYEYSSRYGGDEIDTKNHTVTETIISEDKMSITIKVDNFRDTYVYELDAAGILSESGNELDHPRAWYTLNKIPSK